MKRSIKNKYAMYKSCAFTLESHRELWENIPGISSQVEKFNEQIVQIDSLIRDLGESTRLTTQMKHRTLEELSDKVIILKGVLNAFGNDNGDRELLTNVDFTLNEIRSGAVITRLRTITRISEAGRLHIKELANWNWTEQQQDDLEQLIEKARSEMISPKLKRDELKIKRMELEQVVQDSDKLLKNVIDGLILGFKETQQEFFSKWESAREIIDYRSSKSKTEDESEGSSASETPDDDNY